MGWLRFDDRVRQHPKIVAAGPLASWLWFCGICYCREHHTDGIIPSAMVPALAAGMPKPYTHAATLVQVGLWHVDPRGFKVHDFLDWNPSAAEVKQQRARDLERKRNPLGIQPEGARK